MRSLLLALFVMSAQAQQCLPVDRLNSSPVYIDMNSAGACVRWFCYGEAIEPKRVAYCGTWEQMHLVGSRIQTIQKATDPLKSLQTLGNRITVVPMTDPTMAGMPK
jgi:hypothetical protein